MCLVLGPLLCILTSSSAPLLSSKTVHIMLGCASVICIIGTISEIRTLIGNTSLAAVDKAMYSDFFVLRAISDCNLPNHVMGQLPYTMT